MGRFLSVVCVNSKPNRVIDTHLVCVTVGCFSLWEYCCAALCLSRRKGCQVSSRDSDLTVHTIILLCQAGNLPEVTTLPAERLDVFSKRGESGNLLLYQCRNLSTPPLPAFTHLYGVWKVKSWLRHQGVSVHVSLTELELKLCHMHFSKMAIMASQHISDVLHLRLVQLAISQSRS